MTAPCLLCAGWTIIHPHKTGSTDHNGNPALAWVPSVAVLTGQDRDCPGCHGGFFNLVDDTPDDHWCELDCVKSARTT